ncbi:signal peptidase I [Cellulomonas massiliensis]|uniref:signal peptidase I n=1 Tax=Cellulomonas massiliensis TaxID=1465811 RepID=UPI00037818E3|nr:signal peptidase I [Cellulomonas massiliensis]
MSAIAPARAQAQPDEAERDDPVGGWSYARQLACRAVLAFLATLLLWPLVGAALGWNDAAIASGSMAPRIAVGDVVVGSPIPFEDVRAGQVVTVPMPGHEGVQLTHRVHEVTPEGLVTKGDANRVVDSTRVVDGPVHLARLRVPLVGYPLLWARSGAVLPLGLTVAAVALLAVGAVRPTQPPTPAGRALRALADPRGDERPARGPSWWSTRSGRARRAGVGAAVLVGLLAVGTVPAPSRAAFVSTTVTTLTWTVAPAS